MSFGVAPDSDTNTHFRIYTPGITNQVAYTDRLSGVNGPTTLLSGPGTLPTRTWTHVVVTVQFSTGLGTLYVNGVSASSGTVIAFASNTWASGYLGRSPFSTDPYFHGVSGVKKCF